MAAITFRTFTSPFCALPAENIDTDQIIPARFLTTTERTGLGQHAFHDWRYLPDGSPDPACVLNFPASECARILVAGDNFGCGSSREHAVWALLDAGFDVVISSRFADIFRGNALANGLLPVEVPADVLAALVPLAVTPTSFGELLSVDLDDQQLTIPDGREISFPIAPFARHRLLHGIDELDFILQAASDIDHYESRVQPSTFSTRPQTPAPSRTAATG